MIPIPSTLLLQIPAPTASGQEGHLPWPRGSILSAELQSTHQANTALLIIGGNRLLARVPPNIPMGHVWLELIDRGNPPHFRLLTEQQAIARLAQQLEHNEKARDPDHAKTAHDQKTEKSTAWPDSARQSIPFELHIMDEGRLQILQDRNQQGSKGIIRQHGDAEHFEIHGRLDLEHLGKLMLSLQGEPGAWKLILASDSTASIMSLDSEFACWIDRHKSDAPSDSSLASLEWELVHGTAYLDPEAPSWETFA